MTKSSYDESRPGGLEYWTEGTTEKVKQCLKYMTQAVPIIDSNSDLDIITEYLNRDENIYLWNKMEQAENWKELCEDIVIQIKKNQIQLTIQSEIENYLLESYSLKAAKHLAKRIVYNFIQDNQWWLLKTTILHNWGKKAIEKGEELCRDFQIPEKQKLIEGGCRPLSRKRTRITNLSPTEYGDIIKKIKRGDRYALIGECYNMSENQIYLIAQREGLKRQLYAPSIRDRSIIGAIGVRTRNYRAK
jgi:hypothetical protein